MENCAVILAAGEGKRMKSRHPKVLCEVLFKPMLEWVIDAAHGAGLNDLCVVTGHLHREVEEFLRALAARRPQFPPPEHVLQSEQRGTAHAVRMAQDFLRRHSGGSVLILNGDAPFLSPEVIGGALRDHLENERDVTVISAEPENPFGYGRIVRDKTTGAVAAIVEEKDADETTRKIREINSGAYWFQTDSLLPILSKIRNENAAGEYYLPDAVKLLILEHCRAGAFKTQDGSVVLGANDREQLNKLNSIARGRVMARLMADGVDIPCPDGIMVGPDVTVGPDTRVLPGCILSGSTSVGSGCIIGPNTVLIDTSVGSGCTLFSVHCKGASVADGESLKPFTVLHA